MKKLIHFTFRSTFISFLSVHLLCSVSYGSFYDSHTITSQSCLRVFQPSAIKQRRSWYRHEPKAIGDASEPKYTPKGKVTELKSVEVSNQCQTSECYLFSVVNFINVFNKSRFGSESALISEPYLVAHKFLEHIKEGLRLGVDDPKLIHDLEGGFSYEAFHLTRQVGLVPKRSWQPKIPFDTWDMTKVYRVLKKKVPEMHLELKKLARQKKSWDHPDVILAQQNAYDQLKVLILDFSGPLPTQFNYKNKVYDPFTWEKEFGLPRLALLEIHNQIGYDLPDNYPFVLRQTMTNLGGHYRVLVGSYDSLVLGAKNFIDSGSPVIIDLNWKNDGHSMLMVGYEQNEAGQIVRFKVMNSWGKDFGNSGYAWYTVEDIWKNITGTYRFELAKVP